MAEYVRKQRVLEINPKSPLIEGLLRRVEALSNEEGERDLEAEDELKEVTSILIDGALVRSGYEVPDSNEYVFLALDLRMSSANIIQVLHSRRSRPQALARCFRNCANGHHRETCTACRPSRHRPRRHSGWPRCMAA